MSRYELMERITRLEKDMQEQINYNKDLLNILGISGDFRVNPNYRYSIAKEIEELEQYKNNFINHWIENDQKIKKLQENMIHIAKIMIDKKIWKKESLEEVKEVLCDLIAKIEYYHEKEEYEEVINAGIPEEEYTNEYEEMREKLEHKEDQKLEKELPKLNYKDLLPYVKIDRHNLKRLFEDIYKKKSIGRHKYITKIK